MKLKAVSGIMLSLLLIGVLALAFNIQPVKADPNTIYVDDDNSAGPWDGTQEHPYQNITSALENASDNDTIYVYNGTYYENVGVNKAVSLVGENKRTTIIDGNGAPPPTSVVNFAVTSGKISGFTIRHASRGIHLADSNTTITGNIITQTSMAIQRWPDSGGHTATYCVIEYNNLTQNNIGIAIAINDYNRIAYNNISSSISQSNGIYVWWVSRYNVIVGNNLNTTYSDIYLGANDMAVRGNTIAENNFYGAMRYLASAPSNNIIYHNNFFDTLLPPITSYPNVWNDSYPSGGNYWSDYTDNDTLSGPYQNETGSDGIGDTPYVIDENNQDNYPLIEPWTPSQPTPVGGIYLPVNKLELLAPYIGLTLLLAVAVMAVVFFKHKEEKP